MVKKASRPIDTALRGLVIPEQQQHAHYITKVTHNGKRRAHNITECNLDVYLNRDLINPEQHAAGIRLYDLFYASRMASSIKSCLNVSIGGTNGINKAGLNFQAYESYLAAIHAIHIRYRKITQHVCCIGEWLADVNTTVPVYRRMEALQRGLDDLIAHYGTRLHPARTIRPFNENINAP